jgi:glucose/arabinose dehydrogenase
VAEQAGVIHVVVDGTIAPRPFLDLRRLVHPIAGGDRGLLSLAFSPDYARSGRFYVLYNDRRGAGNIRVVEYRRGRTAEQADPMSARLILRIAKHSRDPDHNGGMLQFGPDGDLYVSVGDGDSSSYHGHYGRFGQTRNEFLADILRIDPRHGKPYTVPASNPFRGETNVRPEIWDYGLRNPWRFWIDRPTGDLYIADVGAGNWEEIDYVRGNRPGLNFGWPCFEGRMPYYDPATRNCPGAVGPVWQYPHTKGRCSIIGGIVVRGPRLPKLAGSYLYTDLCQGELRSIRIVDGRAEGDHGLGVKVHLPTSFGVDAAGRVYVLSLDGPLYRIDAGSGS